MGGRREATGEAVGKAEETQLGEADKETEG